MDPQEILFQLTQFNFRLDLDGLAKRYGNDAQRIQAAFGAAQKKALEYLAQALANPANAANVIHDATLFEDATERLLGEAATITQGLSKFQFPKDLWGSKYKDPFKDWRVRVKMWATTWDLDPAFRALL